MILGTQVMQSNPIISAPAIPPIIVANSTPPNLVSGKTIISAPIETLTPPNMHSGNVTISTPMCLATINDPNLPLCGGTDSFTKGQSSKESLIAFDEEMGLEEDTNPIEYSNGLKRARTTSAPGFSQVGDVNGVAVDTQSVINSQISAGLVQRASRTQ
ncbi:hypothetical protein V6N13_020869 [Hibiscus sabdariffa]|uniref:Uncharacterized protein n=2 Tax=Hibiscus sabdariffa TaxID=183260 RepID=A0ABR1ZPI7_9ROSI